MMTMKRIYVNPQMQVVRLPVLLMVLANSISVNDYNGGDDIYVGDIDDE